MFTTRTTRILTVLAAVVLVAMGAIAHAQDVNPRRMTLPEENLAKEAYLTVPSGAMVAALSYEYEILEDAYAKREIAANTDNSTTLNNTVALDLTYGLSSALTVNAIVPYKYVYNTHRVDSGLATGTPGLFFDSRRGTQGLGDVVVMTYWKLHFGSLLRFGNDYEQDGRDGYDDYIDEGNSVYAGREQGAVVALALGVRLPTGRTDVKDKDGGRLPDDLQLGTGTMDPIVGLLYHHRYYRLGWGASALGRISSQENINHYQWGNEILGAAYVSYRLTRALEWVNQANGNYMERDRLNGAPVTSRGGSIVYYTPSLIYVGSRAVTFQASVQIPIYRNFNESQLSSDYIANVRTTFLID
ncbi:MAG: hypothetical protein AB1792_05140 [Candidatus Zixiibacteriota bacterium]